MKSMYEPIDTTSSCIKYFAGTEGMDEETVRELFIRTGLYDTIKECFLIFSHAGKEKKVELCRSYLDRKNASY